MSVVGDGSKRLHLHRSLRVVIQTALAKAPVRGARKDKIERPVDQIHNFLVWRAVQKESLQ